MALEEIQRDDLRVPEYVKTMQGLLNAEAQFLSALREHAREHSPHRNNPVEIAKIQRDLNHENVLHVARLFFLLKASGCDTRKAVEALLDSHNAQVSRMLEAKDFDIRPENELKKAMFSEKQVFICCRTIEAKPRAAFAQAEIASLLFDHMSRASAINAVEKLVMAGILIEEEEDNLKGTNRKLIQTDGFLEKAFAQYLTDVKLGVSGVI